VAVAVAVIVPDTVCPAAGEVIATVGPARSVLLTVTLTAVEVLVFPAASRARAAMVWGPVASIVVLIDTL
jgi:hypothetical protein